MKQVDIGEIQALIKSRGFAKREIMDFLESGYECAEVSIKDYKSTYIAACCYRTMAKRMGANVKFMQHGNNLYIMRGD